MTPPLPPFCHGLIAGLIIGGLFLFALAIARAARDIEPVDDGRAFGGDDE